jgi:hypothetical protein
VALPAFVASRIAARPAAHRIFRSLEREGLSPDGHLLAAYDRRTDDAAAKVLDSLADEPEAADAVRHLPQHAIRAAEMW